MFLKIQKYSVFGLASVVEQLDATLVIK